MGRPKKEIDQEQFENLCGLQCTLEEICSWFDVCADTLEAWCKRTYEKNFSKVFAEKRGTGKISLRRMQWRLAEKNAAMAIFLGKQFLGQSDKVETKVNVSSIDDETVQRGLKELRELAERRSEADTQ